MPTKLRNIVFIAICICALSIAFIYQGAKWAHVLPANFNNGTTSVLEGSKLQTRPKVSLENIKKGTFQTQTEKWLTTKVPKRDSVMLFNARVQRGVIKAANLACGYDTLPTYFGSAYAYSSSSGVVTQQNYKLTSKKIELMHDAAEGLNIFAEQHPTLSVTVSLADHLQLSESNPTFNLIANAESSDTRQLEFVENLSPNVKYVDLSCISQEQHNERYFKTDHHWNITGASTAYSKIMSEAYPDLSQVQFNELKTYEKAKWYGSFARQGLMLDGPADVITDYTVDLSDTQIKINNTECDSEGVQHIQMYETEAYSKNKLKDRHTEYFHGSRAKVEFHSNRQTGRNLLIIADSYSNSCERYFAKSFDSVVSVDQRYNTETLDDLIENNDVTDVLVLTSSQKLRYGSKLLTEWEDN